MGQENTSEELTSGEGQKERSGERKSKKLFQGTRKK